MKKAKIALAILVGALLIGNQVFAESSRPESLQELYDEERTAQEMYVQLQEKFDNDTFYKKLEEAESRHVAAIKRLVALADSEVKDTALAVKTPDDELEALQAAHAFELEDIKSYEEILKTIDDQNEIRVYENLMKASIRHASILETAIEQFEQGNTNLEELHQSEGNPNRKNNKQNKNRQNRQDKQEQNQRNNGQKNRKANKNSRGRNMNCDRGNRRGNNSCSFAGNN